MDAETKLNRTKYLVWKIHTYLEEYDNKLSYDSPNKRRHIISLRKLYAYIHELYNIWEISTPVRLKNIDNRLSVSAIGIIRRSICDRIAKYNPLANKMVLFENIQVAVEDFLDNSCALFGFLQVVEKLQKLNQSQLSTPTSHSDASSDQE